MISAESSGGVRSRTLFAAWTMKKDEEVALNLPDKLEQKEYCPLTPEQASLYEQLVKDTFDRIEQLSAFERRGLVLQMLSRLKQLCNHPALYLKEERPANMISRSAKLEKLSELLDSVLEQLHLIAEAKNKPV